MENKDNNKKKIERNAQKKNSFGLSNEKKMQKFLDIAEKKGFDFALNEAKKNIYDFNPVNFVKRMKNPLSRSYLSFIINTQRKKALDLGCGYGNLSVTLADVFEKVYSFDINKRNIKTVQIRAKEKGIKNIKTMSGNAFDLDLKEKLDAIFMIGVLEWVPVSHDAEPKESQKILLKKLNSMLNKDGKIVVGIENRFGAQYFFGRQDHGGIKGTNLLPRKIANFVSKVKGKGEYRTYTHTYWQYKKMFEECGFSDVKIYLALTSYVYPKIVIPLEKDKLKYAIDNIFIPRSNIERILSKTAKILPFSLVKLFSPHFIIVGEKKGQKGKEKKDMFDKGIIRTGMATVSTNPKNQIVKKIIHKDSDITDIEKIKKINKETDLKIIIPKFEKELKNYREYREKFITNKKIRPLPKNIDGILEEIFDFVCQLKEKKTNVFFRNFNYGNMIITKNKELNLIGIRNFKEKEDPGLNLVSFFESLYYYNKEFNNKKAKEKIWNFFERYISKYEKKYEIDLSLLIKRYLRLYENRIVLVRSPEFKERIEKSFIDK